MGCSMLLVIFWVSPRGFGRFSRRFGFSFGAIFKRCGCLSLVIQASFSGEFQIEFLHSEDRIGIGLEI